MIVAFNEFTKKSEFPDPGVKGEYHCRDCGEKVFPKFPSTKIWHFSHYPGSKCDAGGGESETAWHVLWKTCWPADESEVNIGKRRVDVADGTYAFEFQHSTIKPEEWIAKSLELLDFRSAVVWMFDVRYLQSRISPHKSTFKWKVLRLHSYLKIISGLREDMRSDYGKRTQVYLHVRNDLIVHVPFRIKEYGYGQAYNPQEWALHFRAHSVPDFSGIP